MAGDRSALGIVESLRGQTPWDIRLGVGSFLTMEFGRREVNAFGPTVHGEWHLWLYMRSWRIEAGERLIAGSEDERSKIEATIKNIVLGRVQEIDLAEPSLDLAMQFNSRIKVLTFSSSSDHYQEQLKLFTPDENCLTVYGDGSYEYSSNSEPLPRSEE